MKKTLLSVALTSVLASTAMISTAASAETTANVSVSNTYLFRGLEQTNGQAAVSGGVDFADESGFYAGVWVSNVDFGDNNEFAEGEQGAETEVDLYFGYGGNITENVSYDLGFIHYEYPDEDQDIDFSEIYASVSAAGFTLGVTVLADARNTDLGDTVYTELDYTYALKSEAEVSFHLANYADDNEGNFGVGGYNEVSAAYSKDGFTFGASKVFFNGDSDDNAIDEAEELKIFVSYTVEFDL